jgi:PEGA domain
MLPFPPVSVFQERPGTHLHVRTPIMIGVILMLVILLSALFYYTRTPAPVAPAAPVATPAPTQPSRESSSAPAPPAAPPVRTAPSRRIAAEPPPSAEPAPPPADTRASLTIESDVPGASVFVDRQFVGTVPLTLNDLATGSTRVNLSADGYDGVSRQVDLEPGPNSLSVRFKEVRLDERMPVVHRHGVGSCEGTLLATVDGFRYDTTTTGDRFTLAFADVEEFNVDYLEKNLRLKQRRGRTWNFTTKAANADALFVFHRDVEAARQKLAKGYTAVR